MFYVVFCALFWFFNNHEILSLFFSNFLLEMFFKFNQYRLTPFSQDFDFATLTGCGSKQIIFQGSRDWRRDIERISRFERLEEGY